MNTADQANNGFLMKVTGSIVMAVMMAAMAWVSSSINNVEDEVIEINLQLIRMQGDISNIVTALEAKTDQRWRKSDAELSELRINGRINELSRRLESIERSSIGVRFPLMSEIERFATNNPLLNE